MRMRHATAAVTSRRAAAAAAAEGAGGGNLLGAHADRARRTGMGTVAETAGRPAAASGPGALATSRTCAPGARRCAGRPAACPGGVALLQLFIQLFEHHVCHRCQCCGSIAVGEPGPTGLAAARAVELVAGVPI